MLKVVGWVGLITLVTILFVNGFFMMVSPGVWFKLPDWLRAQGTITKKYERGWRSVELRITGALIVAAIVYVLWDSSR